MTTEQWLQLPDDKLARELAEALVPKPWKHDIVLGFTPGDGLVCRKCGGNLGNVTSKYQQGVPGRVIYTSDTDCSVPDPVTIDWNTAMEWRNWITVKIVNSVADEIFDEISKIENRCFVYGAEPIKWWLWNAQPKHYLIAAVTAAERTGK